MSRRLSAAALTAATALCFGRMRHHGGTADRAGIGAYHGYGVALAGCRPPQTSANQSPTRTCLPRRPSGPRPMNSTPLNREGGYSLVQCAAIRSAACRAPLRLRRQGTGPVFPTMQACFSAYGLALAAEGRGPQAIESADPRCWQAEPGNWRLDQCAGRLAGAGRTHQRSARTFPGSDGNRAR